LKYTNKSVSSFSSVTDSFYKKIILFVGQLFPPHLSLFLNNFSNHSRWTGIAIHSCNLYEATVPGEKAPNPLRKNPNMMNPTPS